MIRHTKSVKVHVSKMAPKDIVLFALKEVETAVLMSPEKRREHYGTIGLAMILNRARDALEVMDAQG